MEKFHWRRVPGTLTLAITNIIAACLLFISSEFERSLVGSAVLAPPWLLGMFFFAAGLSLLAATKWRYWEILNIGSGLSLFIWTFVCVSVFVTWIKGHIVLSPLMFALLFWMVAGQASMLFVPLWARGRGYE